MNIIIVGCGRVGSQLALLLSQDNNNVTVVDADSQSFANLGRSFDGRTVVGLGFDEDTLAQAGIDRCDVLAAVTDQDNSNLMIAEVGRKLYGVPHVLTRLYNPGRESAYLQLGLDYVCGTTLVAEEMYSKIVAEHGGHVDTFGDYEILSFALNLAPSDSFDGTSSGASGDASGGTSGGASGGTSGGATSVMVGDLERDHEVRIIAFERKDGSLNSLPTKESMLYPGDVVLACVHKDRLTEFSRYMSS
jgi:trk system potassium uptake protein TrkA